MVRPIVYSGALRSTLFLLVLCWLPYAGTAYAQEPAALDAQAPAHISLVDGVALLERDGEIDDSPSGMPLLAGDRIRTRGGRVEILFADGSTLHLDHNSAVDLQSDELVRILEGRIRLSIPGPSREVAYRIDGPHGWAQIGEPGDYRVALLNAPGGSELELAVIRGRAELANEGGRTPLRAGERAFVRAAAAPSYAYVANSAANDAFDRWSEARRDERLSANAQYLPDEVQPYAASFERYGDWRDEPTYGRVWYPRVSVDWRPYYRGRWTSLRPYGWTWVAHDPWGWPTHHYGRWGYTAGSWFWIPGRTWGAAYVSWAYAPGYVSWCPLGWNDRPIFNLNINININAGRRYDHWRGWTILPRQHFGRGIVHRNAVFGDRLDVGVRRAFAAGDRAPEIRGYAAPRGGTPIRVAGTRGGARRGPSPRYTNRAGDQSRIRTDGPTIQVPDARRPAEAPGGTRPRGIERDRTVPDRPAVRSQRTPGPSTAERPSVRSQQIPSSSLPERPAGARRAVPRGDIDRAPARRSESPRMIPRAEAPRMEAPRTSPQRSPAPRPEAPRYERPRIQRDTAPNYGPPAGRAVPRASGEPRHTPGIDRRGPDRAPSGSYERRGAEPSRPSAPPRTSAPTRQDRPAAAPPAGARPRRPVGGG